MTKLILLLFTTVGLSFIFPGVHVQQKLLSGVVVDAQGNGIPSATVEITETK